MKHAAKLACFYSFVFEGGVIFMVNNQLLKNDTLTFLLVSKARKKNKGLSVPSALRRQVSCFMILLVVYLFIQTPDPEFNLFKTTIYAILRELSVFMYNRTYPKITTETFAS